ncbi:Phenylpropionate dioxygenase, large terminal subunit [Butyrivibrio sp. INlla16]|nr:flavin reductase [Butyrivibrio sp. INlla16]SDB66267.1 Phenylpropionate dioxygenase, large terminal subunit [Butyrivibrio sp. INlla16]
MIRNQWYAVLSSHELKTGQVVGARRFGANLIFYRDSTGEVACADSACAHRKASLEKGWIRNDHIKCPFHGIEYDITGKCVYVPSDGRASVQEYARFHLKMYPTREIGGIIFVWYGDKTPTREPDYFDIITDKTYTYNHINDMWNVDYSRVIENQLDVSHLAFVHHNTIGRGNKSLCNGPRVVWLDDNTMQTSADNEVDTGQTPKPTEQAVIKSTNLNFKFPNMWLNHVSDKIQILAYFVPVDDEHAIISLRFYNKITGIKAIDSMIAWLGSRANKVVERQDKRIVETQIPKKTGTDIGECLVAADLPIIEYRSKRRALQNENTVMGKPSAQVNERGHKMSEMNTKAMFKLSYGLFVCSAKRGDKVNGCIINTAIQVASEPNRISVAVNKANYTHDMIKETGLCNVSVISQDASFDLFKHFGFQSGRDVDKFAGFSGAVSDLQKIDGTDITYKLADNGIPYVTSGVNAFFSLKVEQTVDLGSHTLFICEPTAMGVLADTSSCTYEFYQNNIKPKPEAVGTTHKGETVWRCRICGYEWVGEELPDDFICPICKHPKADFEKIVR